MTNITSRPFQHLLITFALSALVTAPAWAATKTVTPFVPGMTCAACPFTIKAGLSKAEGVSKTEVQFEQREAGVTFDDAKTNVQKLTKATQDAGYPSTMNN